MALRSRRPGNPVPPEKSPYKNGTFERERLGRRKDAPDGDPYEVCGVPRVVDFVRLELTGGPE
jgi:hypothetical protein